MLEACLRHDAQSWDPGHTRSARFAFRGPGVPDIRFANSGETAYFFSRIGRGMSLAGMVATSSSTSLSLASFLMRQWYMSCNA
jgi:hypothetical protein